MFTTPAEIYEHSFRIHSALTAVREDDREFTYRDLWLWSDAVMEQLRQHSASAGDVVGMFAGNRAEWLVVESAVARMGLVRTPANHMSALETVAYQLAYAEAAFLVTDYDLGSALLAHLDPEDQPVLLQLEDPAGRTLPDAIPLAPLPPPGTDPDRTEHSVDPESRAGIYFTGGTTGRPKAVSHSARSVAAALYIQMVEAEIRPGERMLIMTPLAHAGGSLAAAGIGRGANVRVVDSFDAHRTVDLLLHDRTTWTFMVPTMIYRVLDLLDARAADGAARSDGPGSAAVDLALNTIVYGAAPMSPTRLVDGLRLLGPVFIQLFGQTEAPQFCTRLSKLDHDPNRPELLASCGNATLFTDIAVTDDAGTHLPPGEFGEITVRTPFALTEYIGNPEATAEKFWDGWVRTGDMGIVDDAGYVYLKDRKNDMIISGGFNVYSREVEDALSSHPLVAQVAVIGVPHHDWGEAVHAVVVKRSAGTDGDELTDEALRTHASSGLARYARPKSIEFTDSLPQTPFGKVDKKSLRAPHWEGATRQIG
ncbi:AMP-binding protein [Brevibacterium jeotgali]|uniref:AMP-binding protein n=1 Tax=Brevibacterium jeotgali TaxID=1262550 RepID=UPI0015E0D150|nr:AMP-binding protein [Brevibacterium jeotgali]